MLQPYLRSTKALDRVASRRWVLELKEQHGLMATEVMSSPAGFILIGSPAPDDDGVVVPL